MPRSYPGSTPGVDPRSQGVIPRRFKRKKKFVTEYGVRTEDIWTHRRDGGNSGLDIHAEIPNFVLKSLLMVNNLLYLL